MRIMGMNIKIGKNINIGYTMFEYFIYLESAFIPEGVYMGLINHFVSEDGDSYQGLIWNDKKWINIKGKSLVECFLKAKRIVDRCK